MGITLDGYSCVDAGSLIQDCMSRGIAIEKFAGLANSFLVPSGVNYGRGWCLLLRRDFDQINIEGLHTFSFLDDSNGSVVFDNLVFIKADAVTPGMADDPNVVMLLELADPRYLLHNPFYSFPLDAQYNVRVPSGGDTIYYPYSTQDGVSEPHDWQSMLDDIWQTFSTQIIDPESQEPIFDESPQLPFDADGTPEKFCFYNVSLWLAYNSIMSRLASRVVPDDTTFSTWSVQDIGNEESDTGVAFQDAIDAFSQFRMYDSQTVQSVIARMPSTLNVVFHKQDVNHGSETTASTQTALWGQWQAHPFYAIQINADPDVDSGTGTQGILWDDLGALNDSFSPNLGSENITNESDLQSRANERALDFTNAIGTLQSQTLQYSGVINDPGFMPGSLVSGYAVYNRGNGYITEVFTSAMPLSVSASGEWTEEWESVNQNLSPPDLSKATFPDYPQVVQWVRPDSVSTTDPKIFDASIGVLDPRVATAGTFQVIGKCWLYNNSGGSLTIGNAVSAGYIGQISANSSASGNANRPFFSTSGSGGAGGVPDTETFLVAGTGCFGGALSIVEKTLTVLTTTPFVGDGS